MVRPLSRASKSPVVFWAWVGSVTTWEFVCAGSGGRACCAGSARGGTCCAVSVLGRKQVKRAKTKINVKLNQERSMNAPSRLLLCCHGSKQQPQHCSNNKTC